VTKTRPVTQELIVAKALTLFDGFDDTAAPTHGTALGAYELVYAAIASEIPISRVTRAGMA
jgi:hypothetical protein